MVDELVARIREFKEEVGEWLLIDQRMIDRFAEVTGDHQWIHIDPERAKKESPFEKTIAHGFLTLSLLPLLTGSNKPDFLRQNYPGIRKRLNYGLNKVRFPAPVREGSRIRARTKIVSVKEIEGGIEIIYLYTVEIEGENKPACVAEQIFRLIP